MKSLIQIVLVALVVGGISAGGSFYWKSRLALPIAKTSDATSYTADGESNEGITKGNEAPKAAEEGARDSVSNPEPDANTIATVMVESANKSASPAPKQKPTVDAVKTESTTLRNKDELGDNQVKSEPPYIPPVAARPPYAPEGDEAGRLIVALRARVDAVGAAERQLTERESVMKLIFDDLRSEQIIATRLRQRVIDEVDESNRFVNQSLEARKAEQESLAAAVQEKEGLQTEVEKMRPLIEDRERATKELEKLRPIAEEHDRLQKELEKLRAAASELDQLRKKTGNSDASGAGTASDSTESDVPSEPSPNLKKTAAIYDTMPPENTAKVIQQLVKNNRTQSAVALLNAMKERPTSKVLSTIAESDPMLAADLTERLKRMQKDPVPQPLP